MLITKSVTYVKTPVNHQMIHNFEKLVTNLFLKKYNGSELVKRGRKKLNFFLRMNNRSFKDWEE